MAVADKLTRVNFVAGLRLDAAALSTEQAYHIDVRRHLTRALFSPGIATGLEVQKSETNPHAVIVSEGVAIDADGRAAILLSPRELVVRGTPSPTEGVVLGNFLAIAYDERRTGSGPGPCEPRCAPPLGRKAPSRIEAQPRLAFFDSWPPLVQGWIVLAQIELLENCVVGEINAAVRRYVATAKPPATRPLSLEGEKDIDNANPKALRFHVDGDFPNAASLYLRADTFSTLYYTELGSHSHPVDFQSGTQDLGLRHTHTIEEGTTAEAGAHTHRYWRNDEGEERNSFDVQLEDRETGEGLILEGGAHVHTFENLATEPALTDETVQLNVTGDTDAAGVSDVAARLPGTARTQLIELFVTFDAQDITPQLIAFLEARDGAGWAGATGGLDGAQLLGGSGEIDLIELGLDLSQGEHVLVFRVPADDGGKIMWNLYLS